MDFLAFFAGLAAGFSALVPFIHANLVLQFSGKFFSGWSAAVFAVVLSFSRLCWESFASVFFAVASPNQGASVLPGHRLALEGKGVAAVSVMLRSFLLSLFFCVLLLPVAFLLMPFLRGFLMPAIPFLLLGLFFLLVFSEAAEKRFSAVLVFLLSGLLGFSLFSFPTVKEPLFPLLTGLFAFPALFTAAQNEEKIPLQKKFFFSISPKLVFAGCLLGFFSGLLPAITPAFLASAAFFFFEASPFHFLSLNAAIVFSKLFYDFVSVATIGKARSGAAAVVMQSAGTMQFQDVLVLLFLGVAAFLLHYFLVRFKSAALADKISRLDHGRLNSFLFLFLAFSILLVSGPFGLFVSATAACVGLLPVLLGTKRAYSTGALIVPALLYYSGLNYFLVSLVR